MAKMVKAAALVEPRRIEIREFPFPEIGTDDAVLRIERAGICGTDPKLYRGSRHTDYPYILGHEILGHIECIGKEMARRHGLKEGDRVAIEGSVPCGHCTRCEQGLFKFCKHRRGYGTKVSAATPPHLWGGFCEYMYVAPNAVIHRVAEHVKSQAAIVAAACLANGIRWVRTIGGASVFKPVVIQGVGPQGLSAVVAAKESGAFPIIVTGLGQDLPRLTLARELGADICINVEKEDVVEAVRNATNGELADTVLDVTGSAQGIALSVQLVKPLGTLVCAGTLPKDGLASIATNDIVHKEIRFQGVAGHSYETTEQAIRLAESGKYPLEKFISHEYSLDETDLAIRAMGREIEGINPIKVAIKP